MKCDGEKPCGRCKTRNLNCHFTRRTWASKRDLRDDISPLREQLNRRERVLDAISAPNRSGEDVVSMLREGRVSYDDMFSKVRGRSVRKMDIDTTRGHNTTHSGFGHHDCETRWSPSTTNSNILSLASGLSPIYFTDHALSDDTISQPFSIPQQLPPRHQQQPALLQQQMDPMRRTSWESDAQVNSFDNMVDGSNNMSPLSIGVIGDCPTVDPVLWPSVTSSSSLSRSCLPPGDAAASLGGAFAGPSVSAPDAAAVAVASDALSQPTLEPSSPIPTSTQMTTQRKSAAPNPTVPENLNPEAKSSETAQTKRPRKTGKTAQRPDPGANHSSRLDKDGVPNDQQRKRILERNRVATTKCRIRERGEASMLITCEQAIEGQNRELWAGFNALLAEIYALRTQLLQHTDCGCVLIQKYIANEAKKPIDIVLSGM